MLVRAASCAILPASRSRSARSNASTSARRSPDERFRQAVRDERCLRRVRVPHKDPADSAQPPIRGSPGELKWSRKPGASAAMARVRGDIRAARQKLLNSLNR